MQVNTKEILLHPPPKGLANCAIPSFISSLHGKLGAGGASVLTIGRC